METTELTTYIVTVDTPKGCYDVELLTHQGEEAAARRAKYTLFMQLKAGTPDDYVVVSTVVGSFPDKRNRAMGA